MSQAIRINGSPVAESSNERHPTLDTLCERLERIMHSRAAADILDTLDENGPRTGIVLLPAWSWKISRIDVGRKDKQMGSGKTLLMPVRNDWDGMVHLVTASTEVTYRTRGMGHSTAGQAKLVQRPGYETVVHPVDPPSLSEPVFVSGMNATQLRLALEDIMAAGTVATWEIIHDVSANLRSIVNRAHSHVSHEIGLTSQTIQPMLDDVGIEGIIDLMQLGGTDSGGKERVGSVFRMIEKSLLPGTFLRVDPLKYMNVHLRRDAETEIRRKLGDPHVGPKVRAIARLNPNAALDEIVREYRKVYPKDRLSHSRAEEALSVRPDIMARCAIMPIENLEAA